MHQARESRAKRYHHRKGVITDLIQEPGAGKIPTKGPARNLPPTNGASTPHARPRRGQSGRRRESQKNGEPAVTGRADLSRAALLPGPTQAGQEFLEKSIGPVGGQLARG